MCSWWLIADSWYCFRKQHHSLSHSWIMNQGARHLSSQRRESTKVSPLCAKDSSFSQVLLRPSTVRRGRVNAVGLQTEEAVHQLLICGKTDRFHFHRVKGEGDQTRRHRLPWREGTTAAPTVPSAAPQPPALNRREHVAWFAPLLMRQARYEPFLEMGSE